MERIDIATIDYFSEEPHIISKPVGKSFELVSRLHTYICPMKHHSNINCHFFMPRIPYSGHVDTLREMYPEFTIPDIGHEKMGVFYALYDIEKIYTGINVNNIEQLQRLDLRASILFNECIDGWINKNSLRKKKYENGNSYKMYILSSERWFRKPKFSNEENDEHTWFYNIKELRKDVIEKIPNDKAKLLAERKK